MASHDSASEEDLEIARILDERHSKNTTKSTKTALKAFVKAAGNVAELQDKEVLDKSLAKFYANAEKKDGSKYKANAMLTLRQARKKCIRKRKRNAELKDGSEETGPVATQQAELQPPEDEKAQDKARNKYIRKRTRNAELKDGMSKYYKPVNPNGRKMRR
ncbi:Hypothetical predicted protein [Paramuricea clavata]|uniref:Uncharacterized protein n=1 Tax=Paramuricea clavata TaxID=317549 RepID=A0A6S7IZQ8_PARCT|nr:Hypothetical predicted protein [Paramuricea clavata]